MDSQNKNIPPDAIVVSQITPDRYYLYIENRPDGMVDPERTGLPVLIDADGSLLSLPRQEQADRLLKNFWSTYQDNLNEHNKVMRHQTIQGIGSHAELLMPEGAFDEQTDIAEMFTIGRALPFKVKLPNGNIFHVLFETVDALEQGVKRALERNSFLHPYSCHVILCHIDLDTMKFAIENLGRTEYFSKLLSRKDTPSDFKITQGVEPDIIVEKDSEGRILKQNKDGVEVVPVKVLVGKNLAFHFNFFDVKMIKSAMGIDGASSQKWMFFSSPNMVILNEITLENIKNCVNQLYKDGAFKFYKSL